MWVFFHVYALILLLRLVTSEESGVQCYRYYWNVFSCTHVTWTCKLHTCLIDCCISTHVLGGNFIQTGYLRYLHLPIACRYSYTKVTSISLCSCTTFLDSHHLLPAPVIPLSALQLVSTHPMHTSNIQSMWNSTGSPVPSTCTDVGSLQHSMREMSYTGNRPKTVLPARRRMAHDQRVFRVPKGVASVDYCPKNNVIITGSVDRIIRVWNPYMNM